jgi:tRNA-specific 2-thiouridylase
MKVVIAMSGGVDSSVAAALLKEEGHDVTGATMQLWPADERVADARRVADKLGIPHHVMNFRDIFAREVIADFCQEYERGRTPNPCLRCNQYLKFGALLERAREMGADFIATGHHARVEPDEATGTRLLKKGVDASKDQSYFLYPLTQEQLRYTLFPIGNFTKDRVREIAVALNLPVASKRESQEICFIHDNDYPGFLKDYIPRAAEPGPILDEPGNILGRHRGVMFYTIGQRRGLGIASRERLYVRAIEPDRNAIVVGTRDEAYGSELIASNVNWIAKAQPGPSTRIKAKIRYRHPEVEAFIKTMDEGGVRVRFAEPQMAITPGQAVVFYDGDTVLGGGIIDRQGSETCS